MRYRFERSAIFQNMLQMVLLYLLNLPQSCHVIFFFFFWGGGGAVRASHLGEMWERAASDKQCLQLPPFFLYLVSAIFRRTARYFAYFL